MIRDFMNLHGKDKQHEGNTLVPGLPQNAQGFLEYYVVCRMHERVLIIKP